MNPLAVRRRVALAACGAAAMLALGGCGGSDDKSGETGTPADFLQAVKLDYKASAPAAELQTYTVSLGKIVNVQVTSDTAGDVVITGVNLSQPVTAKGSTLLVFSANDEGTYDVVLRTKSGDAPIAKLDVKG